MTTLNIYLNNVNNSRNLEELVDRKVPVAFSVIPRAFIDDNVVRKYPDYVKELLREAAKNPNVSIAQRGYQHKCRLNHWVADPWHENYCQYDKPNYYFDRNMQIHLMMRGRRIIEDEIGVSPNCYSPPNHQFNAVTLDLAEEMGYKFFMDKAMIPMKYHNWRKLAIVPENHINGKVASKNLFVYYDEIDDCGSPKYNTNVSMNCSLLVTSGFLEPLDKAVNSEAENKFSTTRVMCNEALKDMSKMLRDTRNVFDAVKKLMKTKII